jgi:hypothetical protein
MRGLPVASAFLSLLLSAALLTGQAPLRQPVFAHFATSTASAEAQRDFDAGLTLLYAFNPQEARRRFERALAADPGFAMAHWGMAMSWGVNINTSFDPASQLKRDAPGSRPDRRGDGALRAHREERRRRISDGLRRRHGPRGGTVSGKR